MMTFSSSLPPATTAMDSTILSPSPAASASPSSSLVSRAHGQVVLRAAPASSCHPLRHPPLALHFPISPAASAHSRRHGSPPITRADGNVECRLVSVSPQEASTLEASGGSSDKTLLTFVLASAALGVGFSLLAAPDVALASESSLQLQIPVESDLRALALGPEGPLVEEFWDNMRRYGLYFLTVASGGIYSLLEPVVELLKNPLTAVLTVVAITGTFYLLYLTLNTMLGITSFDYKYA